MKNEYRIVLAVRPAVALEKPITFKFPEALIVMRNELRPETGAAIGIICRASTHDDSLQQAIAKVERITDGVMSLLSYLGYVGLPPPRVFRGYEITPGKKSGEFIEITRDLPTDTVSFRQIELTHMNKVNEKLRRTGQDSILRIFRALHWYRSGVLAFDIVDKFTSFWIGLETLNPLLREKYNLTIEKVKCPSECSKCGTPCQHETVPTQNGVRQLIRELFPKQWGKIRNLRVDIIHSKESFSSILPRVKEHLPQVEGALAHALDSIFEIEKRESQPGVSLADSTPLLAKMIFVVRGPDLALLDAKIEPELRIKTKEQGITPAPTDSRYTEVQKLGFEYDIKMDSSFVLELKGIEIIAKAQVAKRVEVRTTAAKKSKD